MEPNDQAEADARGQKAVDDVMRKARLASWASDREALARSAPDVVLNTGLGEATKYSARIWASSDPKGYEQALIDAMEAVWPLGCEPTAVPGMRACASVDGVYTKDFSATNFPRRFDMYPSAAVFALEEVHEEVTSADTWTDDRGEEHTDEETYTTVNQLILVTPRVALTVRSGKGVHGDNDYNAELDADLYICENPEAMQTMLRGLFDAAFYSRWTVCDPTEFEDKLKDCYGEQYVAPPNRAGARP